jgi:universal stress protein E
LVAVKNPSAESHPGVRKAAQLARALGAELTLFQAVPTPLTLAEDPGCLHQGLSDLHQCTLAAQREWLEQMARGLRRHALHVSVSVQWDHPVYSAILREAARTRADLIVAEAHPRGHHGAVLRRLTDWELVRHSPLPLLLVKRSDPYRRPKVLVALDPDHTFGKPLNLDAEIIAIGSAVTEALHGSLHAVHAYTPLQPGDVSEGSTSARAIAQIQRKNAAVAAEKLARTVRGADIPKARQHVVGRHVPDAIAQIAAQSGCTLAVMGTVARSGLTRVLIGNTAERLLDLVTCDILVVKPGQHAELVTWKLQSVAPALIANA